MCGTPKTNMPSEILTESRISKSLGYTQRKRFAEVANRAEDRREIREYYQRRVAENDSLQNQPRLSLFSKMKFLYS